MGQLTAALDAMEVLEVLHSAIVSKLEKAQRYASEPGRVSISYLEASIAGDNNTHRLDLKDGYWHCDCDFFGLWSTCAHVMTLQQMLGQSLPETARVDIYHQLESDNAVVLGARA